MSNTNPCLRLEAFMARISFDVVESEDTSDWDQESQEVFSRIKHGARDCKLFGVYRNNLLYGVLTSRIENEKLKIINVCTRHKGSGVGSLLIREACESDKGFDVFLKANPNAVPFYEKLGMSFIEKLDDGRSLFHWTSDKVNSFLKSWL